MSKRPRLPKAPQLAREPELRRTELIGLTEDGRMVLWDVGNVRPCSTFPMDGQWIESGHHVINWKGHAITVHLGNTLGRGPGEPLVSVQFMCSGTGSRAFRRGEIEPLLLGKVVRDPEEARKISEMLEELLKLTIARYDQPHRQRGRIGPDPLR